MFSRIRDTINRIDIVKLCAIVFAVAFALSLIPVLAYSLYIHPLYDDFGSYSVHDAYLNSGILAAVKEAFSVMKTTYFSWQGTFAANIINNLNPNNFKPELYGITPFIMIGALFCSISFLCYSFFTCYLYCRKAYAIIASSLILISYIQFVPSKIESFYWFNGSSIYTLFYSFMVFMFSLLLLAYNTENRFKRVVLLVFCSLLAFVIGGGNFCTALLSCEILGVILLVSVIKKNRKIILTIVFPLVLNITSLFISIIAPGNSLRADPSLRHSPVIAIAKSVFVSGIKMCRWTGFEQAVVFIILIPLLYNASKKCKWSFKYPLAVLAVTYLLCSSQYVPNLYADNTRGPMRLQNICFYFYYLFVIFNMFYFFGWINKYHSNLFNSKKMNALARKNIIPIALVLSAGLFFGCYTYGLTEVSSIGTTYSIVNHSAEKYDEEYNKIIKTISEADKTVTVNDIETVPCFLQKFEFAAEGEENFWINQTMAKYYHLESIEYERENTDD